VPETLELILGNQIYIDKEGLHPTVRDRLLRLAAFQNPEFYQGASPAVVDVRQAPCHCLR
jgi:hypothetical protein